MNNFAGEYKDWTPAERKEFSQKLVHVFEKPSNRVNGFSYSVEFESITKAFPETRKNPRGYAYQFLLKLLMCDMCKELREANQDDLSGVKVALVHERCAYDAALLQAFNSLLADPTFSCKGLFASLVPMGWEDCTPLQPADFLAYENFKETWRHISENDKDRNRDRRIPLKELLGSPSFGGVAKHISDESMQEWRKLIDTKTAAILDAQGDT